VTFAPATNCLTSYGFEGGGKGVFYLKGFSTAQEYSETHEFAVCTLDKSRIGKVVSRDTGKTTSVATRENQSKFPVPESTLTHRGAQV